MVSWSKVLQIAGSEVVFAILFIVLATVVIKWVGKTMEKERETNNEREQYIFEIHEKQMIDMKNLMDTQRDYHEKREAILTKLMEKNTEQLGGIAETMRSMERSLSKLEKRVDDNFVTVWKELGSKQDKKNQ